jgi:hypothetical protein
MGSTFQKINSAFLAILIAGFATPASASPENDRVYQLDSLGWLKPSDNMDGVFSDYLEEQFGRYFSGQGRFLVKPLKGLSEVLGKSSAKYAELVQQTEILKKISRKYQVEDILRSRVTKEGDSYRFEIEWVYAPKGDVVARVDFRYLDQGLESGVRGEGLAQAVSKGLEELIAKLPFLGSVTGVEDRSITISLGNNVGIKPGQLVTIYTLQSVKRHPLLHTIEEWRWQPVGRAQIEQVEPTLSFAKVIETEPNMKVVRDQKVREILAAPVETKNESVSPGTEVPKSGWIAGNMGVGTYAREVGTSSSSTSGRGGSGLLGNFELDSQVWLNSRYIAQATLGGAVFNYTPTDLSTGVAQSNSYNGTETHLRLAFGYSLFPMKSVFDPIAWIHLGYRYNQTSFATNPSDFVASTSLGSVILGVGGEFPVFRKWSAQLGMDLGVIRSGTAVDLGFGDASPTSDLTLRGSILYRWNDRLTLRTQIMLHSENLGFPNGESITQKLFSVSPSIMYYF